MWILARYYLSLSRSHVPDGARIKELLQVTCTVCILLLPMQSIVHSDMPFPSVFPEQVASRLFCSSGTKAKSQKALCSVWIPHCEAPLCEAVLSSCSPTATVDDIVCCLLSYRLILHMRERKITPWVNRLMPVGHVEGVSGKHRDVVPSVIVLWGWNAGITISHCKVFMIFLTPRHVKIRTTLSPRTA